MDFTRKIYNDDNDYIAGSPAMQMWEHIEMQLDLKRILSELQPIVEAEAEEEPENMTHDELIKLLQKVARPTKYEKHNPEHVSDEEHRETIKAAQKLLQKPHIQKQLASMHRHIGSVHGGTIGTRGGAGREAERKGKESDVGAAFMTGISSRHRAGIDLEKGTPAFGDGKKKRKKKPEDEQDDKSYQEFVSDLGVEKGGGHRTLPVQKIARKILHHYQQGKLPSKIDLGTVASYMRRTAQSRGKDILRAKSRREGSLTGAGGETEDGERRDLDPADKKGGEVPRSTLKDILRAVRRAQKSEFPLKGGEGARGGRSAAGLRRADPSDPNVGKRKAIEKAKRMLLTRKGKRDPGDKHGEAGVMSWPETRAKMQGDPEVLKNLGLSNSSRTAGTKALTRLHKKIISHPAVQRALSRSGVDLGQQGSKKKKGGPMSFADLRSKTGLSKPDDSPDYDSDRKDAEAERRRQRDKGLAPSLRIDRLKQLQEPPKSGATRGEPMGGRTMGRKRYSPEELKRQFKPRGEERAEESLAQRVFGGREIVEGRRGASLWDRICAR